MENKQNSDVNTRNGYCDIASIDEQAEKIEN